jgi:hypothetical protein
MTKQEIIDNLIESWKPVFDAYPNLIKLPVYSWGRYYKYECAGSPFERFVEDGGMSSFKFDSIENDDFDWDLIEKIDGTECVPGGKIWTGDWGEFVPSRVDMVKHWKFDDRFGKCVVIIKKDDKLVVEVFDCDSPE